MPTLADLLRTGYKPPTESALGDPIVEHFRTLPQQLEANQRAMDKTMGGMYKTDPLGRPNPNYYPEAMQEFTQNYLPNVMGSISKVAPTMTAIYHGTTPEAAANIAKRGFNVNKSADGTIWFTTNPEIGEVAATGKGAVVKRLLDENNMKLATREQADKYFIDQLINEGYQGIKHPDMTGGTHYQIFDPKLLKKEKITRKDILAEELNKLEK